MQKEFKYNLNKLLSETDRGLPISTIENMLQVNYGIPAPTFRKDRAIEKDSDKTIKEDRMAAYATFFNTSEDKLRNYELPSNKSLKQLKTQTTKEAKSEVEEGIGFRKLA